MDTLTHAIEGYTNRFAVPLVDALALEAARLVALHLRRAVGEGTNEEARYGMSLASLLGGLVPAIGQHGRPCMPWRIPWAGDFTCRTAWPIRSCCRTSCGSTRRWRRPDTSEIAEAMGAADAVAAVVELSQAVGTNRRMREFGVEAAASARKWPRPRCKSNGC